MVNVKAILPDCQRVTSFAAVMMALTLQTSVVFADQQSEALAQAQSICHGTSISPRKKASALSGWQPVLRNDEILWHAGAGRLLIFGGGHDVPYQLDAAALRSAIPTLEQGVGFEMEDMTWLADEGSMTFHEHPSGWTMALELDDSDPTFTSCILWHQTLSEPASTAIQNLTGIFPSYDKPFQTLTEVNAWMTLGTFDHDLYLAVSRPRQDIYPYFANTYLIFEHYSYDLTEDY